MHVHVTSPDGEAKFWIDPVIALATVSGLNTRQIRILQKLVETHEKEIRDCWAVHFKA